MKVIVLMAGEGKRFKDAGYKESKPFIDVVGKPMVERMTDSLPFLKDVFAEDWWFALRAEDYSKAEDPVLAWSSPLEILQDRYGKEINTVVFNETTRGSLETAKIVADRMVGWSENARYDDLLILDCDNIFNGEGFDEFLMKRIPPHHSFGAICHFAPIDDTNHWCFAMKGKDDIIEVIWERSDLLRESGADPVMGVWYFSSVNLFKSVADVILGRNETNVDGEFYMSQAMSELIMKGFPVYGFEVTEPEPVGTPEYLEAAKLRRNQSIKEAHGATQSFVPFEETVQLYYRAEPTRKKKLRICIDIDGTINHTKKPDDSYGHELPQDMAASTIREWKRHGHYIILYTARHMKTCEGSVGKVLATVASETIKWLEKQDIPYDELHFGKPWADIYIDDRSYRHTNWLETQRKIEQMEKSEIPSTKEI